MKIKHYSFFNGLSTENIDWNHLRNSDLEEPYYIPFDKKDYLELMDNLDFNLFIKYILQYCNENNINRVISIGAGRCGLEYHLKSNSRLEVIVTDTTDSILRIKNFNIFDGAYQLNLLEDSTILSIDENTMVLLCRIDTEFDDNNFKRLFNVLHNIDVKHITLIPAELLSLKIIIAEFKIQLMSLIKNKKLVFCGFARSKSEFRKAWQNKYKESLKYSKNNIFQLIYK
jgi:hypothetical protein